MWLKLIPKLNLPDNSSSDASHELDNAENMSTFDDPTRLINKFHSIFPTPPPPPYTPPFTPPQSDPAYVTTQDDMDDHTHDSIDLTEKPKPYEHQHVTPKETVPISKQSTHDISDSSNVPLSVVIAIGCSLLFLNLLVFAGMYYQRKRIVKMRESIAQPVNHLSAADIQDSRNCTNFRGGSHEAVNLVHSFDTQPKVASLNHKPVSDSASPVYTAISKPVVPPQGPGGYAYSALSQKTSSPMHSQNQTTSFSNVAPSNGPPSEGGGSHASSRGSDSLNRPPTQMTPSDRSPKVDPRTKHIARGSHQPTSNNAITIV